MQKKKERKNKGITLIALVITIIVLLILAGVSIAMLTGENGILTQANDSQVKSIEGRVAEEINLAVQSAKIEAEDKSLASSGWTESERIDKVSKWIRDELNDSYQVSSNSNQITITYNGQDYKKAKNDNNAKITSNVIIIGNTFSIDESSTPGEDSGSEWTKSIVNDVRNKIGTEVTYKNQTWQILYAGNKFASDGKNHVYLILKGKGNNGNLWGSRQETTENVIANTEPICAWYTAYGPQKVELGYVEKYNYTAAMLNPKNWESYYNKSDAEWAIGGPTEDLFIESYNVKNGLVTGTDGFMYTREGIDFNDGGYYDSRNGVGSYSGKTPYDHDLFPSGSVWNQSFSYFLASPCNFYNTTMRCLGWERCLFVPWWIFK